LYSYSHRLTGSVNPDTCARVLISIHKAYTFDHWIYNILVNFELINKQLGLSEMGEELLRAANARSDAE
jgi:hypothetical protein